MKSDVVHREQNLFSSFTFVSELETFSCSTELRQLTFWSGQQSIIIIILLIFETPSFHLILTFWIHDTHP